MDIHLLNALGITNCALFRCNSESDIECLTPELPWLANVVTIDENNKLQKKHIPSIFLDDFFSMPTKYGKAKRHLRFHLAFGRSTMRAKYFA